MRNAALLLAILIAAPLAARADTLADVRRSLLAFRGKSPIRAVLDIVRSRHSQGRFLNDDFEGSATVDVGMDGSAIHMTMQRNVLDRADVHRPTAMTLSEVIPTSIENALDFSAPLLRIISRGRVVEDRPVMYDARPARLLRVELPPSSESEDATAPKVSDDSMTLWLEGAVPVAAKRVRKGTAGILLVRIDTVRTESWKFAPYGDHLVALRFEDRSIVSGSLQHGDASTTWTVRNAEVTQ